MSVVSVSRTACYGTQEAVRWDGLAEREKALQSILTVILKLLDDISESDPPDPAQGDANKYRNAINFPAAPNSLSSE